MPQVRREGPRIHPLVDQLEAGRVTQQVRMDACHADALSRPHEQLEEPVRGERRATFGDEDEAPSCLLLPAQLRKRPDLDPLIRDSFAFTVLSRDLVLTFRTMANQIFYFVSVRCGDREANLLAAHPPQFVAATSRATVVSSAPVSSSVPVLVARGTGP